MGGNSGGIFGGAASGASVGSYFGPYGAVIGGVAGGVMGAMSDGGVDDGTDAMTEGANKASGISAETLKRQLEELQKYTDLARNDLTSNYDKQNFTPILARTSPYSLSGYNSLDMVNLALGLPTVKGGSFNLSRALESGDKDAIAKKDYDSQLKSYQDAQSSLSSIPNELKPLVDDYINQRFNPAYANVAGNIGTRDRLGYNPNDPNNVVTQAQAALQDIATAHGNVAAGADANYANAFSKNEAQIKSLLDKYNAAKASKDPGQFVSSLTPEQKTLIDQYNSGKLEYDQANPNQLQDFVRSTPGWQFAVDTANKGVEASAAAKGMALSSNNLEALNQTNQKMADSQYNTILNNLMQMAGMGANVATNEQNTQNTYRTNQNASNRELGTNLANTYLNLGNKSVDLMGVDSSNRGNAALTAALAQSTGSMAQGQRNDDMFGQGIGMLTNALNKNPSSFGLKSNTGITRSV